MKSSVSVTLCRAGIGLVFLVFLLQSGCGQHRAAALGPSERGASGPVGQPTAWRAEGHRTVPVVLIVPTYRQSDALVQAWNEGLGKPFDLVSS